MISFDTNLLLHSLDSQSPFHEGSRLFFKWLGTQDRQVLVCELVLIELYVLLRNPAVARKPMESAAAVELLSAFRRHPRWKLIDYPGQQHGVMEETWRFLSATKAGRRIIFDARLAFTLRFHGVTQFATRNTKDFVHFGFEKVWDPLTTD